MIFPFISLGFFNLLGPIWCHIVCFFRNRFHVFIFIFESVPVVPTEPIAQQISLCAGLDYTFLKR